MFSAYCSIWTKPLGFTIPVGMVSLQVRCDGSQVWCVTFYPWCDPCYALIVGCWLLLFIVVVVVEVL